MNEFIPNFLKRPNSLEHVFPCGHTFEIIAPEPDDKRDYPEMVVHTTGREGSSAIHNHVILYCSNRLIASMLKVICSDDQLEKLYELTD